MKSMNSSWRAGRGVRRAGALLAAAAAVVSVGAATGQPASASAPASSYGISAGGGLQWLSAADRDRTLDDMVTLGVKRVRFDMSWSDIQFNGATTYDWAKYDSLVGAITARGITPLAVIAYTPPWARPSGCTNDDKCAPALLSGYNTFVSAAVNRYKTQNVHEWEIWNEPNLINFWKPAPDAVKYAQMLSGAYTAAKTADSTAVVVSGGMSPASDDGTNIAPTTFLTRMYQNGAGGKFDALGHHPYCYPAGPTEYFTWSAWSQMADTPISLRSIMVANGDGAKKIWMTEFGAPTAGANANTEAAQAQWVTNAYDMAATYSWAGPLFVYNHRDAAGDVGDSFGLLRSDWSKKPSWDAYSASSP